LLEAIEFARIGTNLETESDLAGMCELFVLATSVVVCVEMRAAGAGVHADDFRPIDSQVRATLLPIDKYRGCLCTLTKLADCGRDRGA
jgi:hypothetical protein